MVEVRGGAQYAIREAVVVAAWLAGANFYKYPGCPPWGSFVGIVGKKMTSSRSRLADID